MRIAAVDLFSAPLSQAPRSKEWGACVSEMRAKECPLRTPPVARTKIRCTFMASHSVPQVALVPLCAAARCVPDSAIVRRACALHSDGGRDVAPKFKERF